MVGGQLHIMYIYGDWCSVFHYVMLILLNSIESELIYMENKGCHWRRVCDNQPGQNLAFLVSTKLGEHF